MAQILIPDLGKGIDTVKVVAWYAKTGDRVTTDDDIVELVTDKAVFNVPAPKDGVLSVIHVQAGDEVPVNAVLGIVE